MTQIDKFIVKHFHQLVIFFQFFYFVKLIMSMFEISYKHVVEIFYKSSSLISAKHAMKHIIKV
jgi:hypothetical protein